MHCSPYLSQDYGPTVYLPATVFQHFLDTKYPTLEREYIDLYEREEFLKALKSNEKFSKFWTHIQEQHPEKKEYFLSLTNHAEPYDFSWIEGEHERYRQQYAFDSLSDEERRIVQNEFDQLRPAAYRVALEGESERLNCDITDVMPTSPVLLWQPDHEQESMLAKLPEALIGRVLPLLETLDIFRMTLVCKRWKMLVSANSRELKKAEHALTTHSIRCTSWMDPAKTPGGRTFLRQYRMFSWCLTSWFCGISENLESLILDHEIHYINLTNLLQSCPNLKHLRIGYHDIFTDIPLDTVLARVKLRKLEVFMYSGLDFMDGSVTTRQLHRDILTFSPSLRVYKGPLDSADFFVIDAQNPVTNVFSKLVVLDLETFTASALEILAHIDGLQLKYLRLGSHDNNSEAEEVLDKDRLRNALHHLLPKLKKLEMLRTSEHVGVTNDTIQLMTDLELNINWAVLYHSYFPTEYDEEEVVPPFEKDPLEPEVLTAFRSMLLSKNPDIDLSEIRLVLKEGKTLEALEAMNTGFTILKADAYVNPTIPVDELYDPEIKQRLGINF